MRVPGLVQAMDEAVRVCLQLVKGIPLYRATLGISAPLCKESDAISEEQSVVPP